jgi:hypothetical protein
MKLPPLRSVVLGALPPADIVFFQLEAKAKALLELLERDPGKPDTAPVKTLVEMAQVLQQSNGSEVARELMKTAANRVEAEDQFKHMKLRGG